MIKAIFFDLDGTLTKDQSSWNFIHKYFGVDNSMAWNKFLNGEITYEEFMRLDISLWLNKNPRIHIDELEDVLNKIELADGIDELFEEIKRRRIKTAIISCGIYLLAKRFEGRVDRILANKLEIDGDGYLTGRGIPIVKPEDKGRWARKLIREFGIDREESVAVGDGDLDIPMFREVGLGIAVSPVDEPVDKRMKENCDISVREVSEILNYL